MILQVFQQQIDGEEHLGLACITGHREEMADGTKYAEMNVKAVLIPTKGRRKAKQVEGEVKRVTRNKKAALPE